VEKGVREEEREIKEGIGSYVSERACPMPIWHTKCTDKPEQSNTGDYRP